MKKVVFIVSLLIILATAWTLYLTYDMNRFAESLGKPPDLFTQSTDISDTPIASENEKTVVENTHSTVKQAETDAPPSKKSTSGVTVGEVIETFEKKIAEADGPQSAKIKDSFEDFLKSQGISKEEYERQEIAKETFQRIIHAPLNWLDGNSNVLVLSSSEVIELLESANVLNSTEEHQELLEQMKTLLNTEHTPVKSTSSTAPNDGGTVIKQNDGGTVIKQNDGGTVIKQNKDGSFTLLQGSIP